MAGSVPVAKALADIYPPAALPTELPRWNNLVQSFEKVYGSLPSHVARSPGRVNIIGEHIDYSLYAVLPMAITADCLLAYSARPSSSPDSFRIRLANVNGDKFPVRELTIPAKGDIEIDATQFEWSNYFKSGLRGALGLLQTLWARRGQDGKLHDIDLLMDGTVPIGGGLSSSAAFVTTSALAVLLANGEDEVDKMDLTQLAIVSERAVGVNSGGMDQSASVLSEQGSALLVSFSPKLEAKPIRFPTTKPELCFLVAQSFVTSNKQVTGPVNYNLRVVEVSMAAVYLNAVLNPPGTQLPEDAGPLGVSLHGFHDTYFYHQNASDLSSPKSLSKKEELERLIAVAKETLTQEEGYTREDVAKVLGISVEDLEKRFMSKLPVRAERFKLRQRTLHVFSEALRVLQFLEVLDRSVDAGAADTVAFNKELGRLMNESQESSRLVYENSCAELDQICDIGLRAGAYASRLTGAGWGGCTVHLVPADRVADVQEALEREYYSQRELTDEQKQEAVVVSRPGHGSAIYTVQDKVI